MLIDTINTVESDLMMNFMKKHPEKVNWKSMFKGEESLSYQLRNETNYYLKKLGIQTSNFIPYLMESNKGLYVCVLTDNNYAENMLLVLTVETSPN